MVVAVPLPVPRVWVLVLAAAAVAVPAVAARGGTIRDDRDPALYTALGADPAYQSVGLLQVDVFEEGQPAIGSGTLVSPQWVMTAAHVVEGGRAVRFDVGGQTYTAARWVSQPKYDGNLIRGYDLALVELDRPVAGVAPAQLYRGKRELGLTATFVGFGRTGTGLTGDVTDDRTKRAGTNAIDGQLRRDARGLLEVVPKLKPGYRTFAADFDQPGNPLVNRIGSPEPTDLEYLISRGDSGGAVFVDDPKDRFGPQVAGINSFGEIFDERDDSSYGDMTGHTRVSAYAKWVNKVVLSERYRRKLRFVTPTLGTVDGPDAQPLTGVVGATDAAARTIGAYERIRTAVTGVPEPTSAFAAFAGTSLGLLGRRSRRR